MEDAEESEGRRKRRRRIHILLQTLKKGRWNVTGGSGREMRRR